MTNQHQHQCGAQSPGSSRTCTYPSGHTDAHGDGTVAWHNVQPLHTKSREAQWAERIESAGGNRDELILQLFDRVEQLEQTSAGGAATDDMFAEQAKRITQLEERVREQGTYANGPCSRDLSAFQASITNHINRALAHLGQGIEQRHAQTGAKLDTMWETLQVMAEAVGALRSEQVPDGARTEHTSGNPAAVRCPTQFREGPCLGYAGHDGDCSVVPDSDNPQVEDPSEF